MSRAPARPRPVWVTRTAPGAEATAEKLRRLGFETVVSPLLQVRTLPGAMINLKGVGALAFTSVHGVTGFTRRSLERGLTVYAVGAGTATAAKAAGFARVLTNEGGVEALTLGIAAHRDQIEGAVLHAGAVETAGDLAGGLAERGVKVRTAAVYESFAAEVPADLVERLPTLHAVTVHSPKAARLLADLLRAHPAPRLRACCLSRAVARPLARTLLAQLSAAARPTEDALIDLFRR